MIGLSCISRKTNAYTPTIEHILIKQKRAPSFSTGALFSLNRLNPVSNILFLRNKFILIESDVYKRIDPRILQQGSQILFRMSDPSSVIQGPCLTAEGLMAVLAEVSPSAVGGDMAVPDDMASMAARAFIRLDVEQRPYSQELLIPFLFPSHRRILGVCKNHS